MNNKFPILGEDMRRKVLRYAFITASVITLVAAALRTSALFLDFEPDIGYYATSAVLPVVFNVLCIVAVVLFAAFAVVAKRGFPMTESSLKPIDASASGSALFVSAFISAVSLTASLAVSLSTHFADDADTAYLRATELIAMKWIFGISVVTTALSVLYFLAVIFARRKYGDIHGWLGMAVALRSIAMLAILYFDMNIAMNNPNKLLVQIALLTVTLYMLSEVRFFIGRPTPNLHLFISLTALFVLGIASLPDIIVYTVTGKYYCADYVGNCITCFALFLYIAVRTIRYLGIGGNKVGIKSSATAVADDGSAEAVNPADSVTGNVTSDDGVTVNEAPVGNTPDGNTSDSDVADGGVADGGVADGDVADGKTSDSGTTDSGSANIDTPVNGKTGIATTDTDTSSADEKEVL